MAMIERDKCERCGALLRTELNGSLCATCIMEGGDD